jgi:hypothetical protein
MRNLLLGEAPKVKSGAIDAIPKIYETMGIVADEKWQLFVIPTPSVPHPWRDARMLVR